MDDDDEMFVQTFITSPLYDGITFTNLYNNKSVYLEPYQIKELIN